MSLTTTSAALVDSIVPVPKDGRQARWTMPSSHLYSSPKDSGTSEDEGDEDYEEEDDEDGEQLQVAEDENIPALEKTLPLVIKSGDIDPINDPSIK